MTVSSSRVALGLIAMMFVAATATAPVHAVPQAAAQTVKPVIPLRVVVTMSRFQGEKKTASVPFEFIVNANELSQPMPQSTFVDMTRVLRTAQVRIGVNVPAGVETTTSQAGVATSRPTYRYVGTNIDCSAETLDDGRFRIYISIEDSSVFTADPSAPAALRIGEPTAFRSLSTSGRLTAKDGQTVLLTTAADRLSGDVVKVEVTATVLK